MMTPKTPDPTPEERQRAAELRRGAEPPFPAPPVDAEKPEPLDLTDYGEAILIAAEAQAAGFQRVAVAPEHFLALVSEIKRQQACHDALRALLERAWDKLPEGYTVLRGEILTAIERPGCIYCGFACSESVAGSCDRQIP